MTSTDQDAPGATTGDTSEPSPDDAGWLFYSEGWDPGYGNSADFDIDASDGVEQAEPGAGHVPRAPAVDVPLAFIDGIRREELAVWAEHPTTGTRVPCLAGAYAVGAVTAMPGRSAAFSGIYVGRIAVWGGGHARDIVGANPRYRWVSDSIARTEPAECLARLQDRMRRAEGDLAGRAANANWNVVLDGPLNRIRSMHPLVTGYVKSHHQRILPLDVHAAVPALGVGERTRIYTAGSDRYTCYVRIGHPGPGASPWSGIARLEFPAVAGIVAVAERATMLATLLPTYAGAHHRDERAPVNLNPVKNLEQRLAKMLGPKPLASRAARDAVISGAIS